MTEAEAPDREPRRDRRPDHPHVPRAGHPVGRRLLRRRPRRPARRDGRRGVPDRARARAATPTCRSARSSRPRASRRPRWSIPGYGFLAERAHFAQAVDEAGFTFVGPVRRARSSRWATRRRRGGSPTPPACRSCPARASPVDVDAAKKAGAARIGYPLLVKAAFGGGGKGMHVVRDAEHLEESLKRAAREAQSYFGRPEVFLERYVDRAHHVEAQIIADTHGNVVFLGERDCSVQRRHQKLIEETPSPLVDDALRERFARGRDLARARGELRQRRHDRVHPRRGRLVLLPGDEHAAPGRAHRHRDGDRAGPRRAADRRRAGRVARRAGGRAARARDPMPDQRGGPGPQLPAGARPDHRATSSPAGRSCGSTPAWPRAARSRATTTRCSRS